MNLNPPTVLNSVFNALDTQVSNFRVYLYFVFVWLSLAAITGVLSDGLRRNRSQGNSGTIIPGILITTRPPIQPPPLTSIIITGFDPAQNSDDETMDES